MRSIRAFVAFGKPFGESAYGIVGVAGAITYTTPPDPPTHARSKASRG
jgi:hypothetical protein